MFHSLHLPTCPHFQNSTLSFRKMTLIAPLENVTFSSPKIIGIISSSIIGFVERKKAMNGQEGPDKDIRHCMSIIFVSILG